MPLSRCFQSAASDVDGEFESDVDDEWVSYLIMLVVHVLLLSGDGILVMTVLGLLGVLFFPSLDACLQRW